MPRPARPFFRAIALAACLSATSAVAGQVDRVCAAASPLLPARAASAPSGSEFAHRIAALSGLERDRAIVRELLDGNLPEHLRRARPVVISPARPGLPSHITLCVLPDYLAVGSDADFLLVPMGLAAAIELADTLGFALPTRRIVDAIHDQASIRLEPRPLPAGDEMRSTAYVERHNAIVRAQREQAHAGPDALISGQKKDLVLSNRLWASPGRVAIYGWHRLDGAAIQPLSTVHGARYADYSHGVRLVSDTAFADGQPVALSSLLRDPLTAGALSDEGPVAPPDAWRALVASDAAAGGPW
jgi:hypothetical protein